MWFATGVVEQLEESDQSSIPIAPGSRSRNARPGQDQHESENLGFVAACIRLSRSGSLTTPIAAIMASNAPRLKHSTATTSAI
jgi:hypothetical protein